MVTRFFWFLAKFCQSWSCYSVGGKILWGWSWIYREILLVRFWLQVDCIWELRLDLICPITLLPACLSDMKISIWCLNLTYAREISHSILFCSSVLSLINLSVQNFLTWSKICPASVLKLPLIGSRQMAVKSSLIVCPTQTAGSKSKFFCLLEFSPQNPKISVSQPYDPL